MERLVKVSVFEFATKYSSNYYIYKATEYDVKCTVVDRNMGLLKDKYLLKLKGTAENIQNFLDYLKYEGFKIG